MKSIATLLLVVGLLGAATVARAADEEEIDAFARVVVAETALRSGPGVTHRVIYRATRGETFLIEGREGTGFWLKVVLPDGRQGWVLGDTVEPIGAGPDAPEGAVKPGFFAPPALQEANAGFALMGGVIDGDGYVEIRPAWVIAPAIALEPYAGLALQRSGRRVV
ncbi:MAG TPA: SH3 domain-containing protein, partial [Polyangiaceae bacterium]|nr:SH3 domain-containing protein [Polyangiaceae bacterium]